MACQRETPVGGETALPFSQNVAMISPQPEGIRLSSAQIVLTTQRDISFRSRWSGDSDDTGEHSAQIAFI